MTACGPAITWSTLHSLHPELLPCVVFTDLRMPKLTGIELTAWARSNPHFDPVRFVIISTSQNDRDRESAKAAGADEYLVKFPSSTELAQLFSDANGRRPSKGGPSS